MSTPFRVLAKINDNAYKIELPKDYGVSTTFNVADLTPYFGPEESESRTTPFQDGEDDEAFSTKPDVNQAHDVGCQPTKRTSEHWTNYTKPS